MVLALPGVKIRFSKVCTVYMFNLWIDRSGRKGERKEMTEECTPVCILASAKCWLKMQLFRSAHRRIFTLHFTHLPCQRVTYAHTQTRTLRVKPLLITMARLVLQPLTPFLNCPALAGAHICEHFSWAVSPSQQAAKQKQLVKRSVEVVQMRHKTCVPQYAHRTY